MKPKAPLCLLALASILRSVAGAQPSLSYAYTFQLSPAAGSFLQTPSLGTASGTACSGTQDCQSKCPTTDFTADSNASLDSLQQQLYECANAFRTSPESFADAINAACSLSAFQSDITNPQRLAFAASQPLSDLAEAHTNDMAANNSFSHTSSTGQSPADRIRAVFPNTNALGEVIAAGYTSVQAVIVGLMCSDSHRAIITSCDYDTAGWGVEYGSVVNGQQVRATYNSYFTGDFLCSNPAGCSCTAGPGASAPSGAQPPQSTAASSPQSTVVLPSPAVQPPAVASPPIQNPTPPTSPTGPSLTSPTGSPPTSPTGSPPPPTSPIGSPPPPAGSPPPPAGSPPPPSPTGSPPPLSGNPTGSPPQQPSTTPALTPASSSGSSATAITFDVTFNQIAANSLTDAQTASVIEDLRSAIANYASPVKVAITINGSAESPSTNPQAGSAGRRRLQQSENTVQATVTFLATTSASSSADSSKLVTDLTNDINTYNAPITVTVTTNPVTSGSTQAVQVSIQFPPNNQVSTTAGYTTQLASSFASAAANQTSTVFPTVISNEGSLSISNVATSVKPVSAAAATGLGPPAPIRVIGTGGSSGAPTSPPTSTPSASPPQESPPVSFPTPPTSAPLQQPPPVFSPPPPPPPPSEPPSNVPPSTPLPTLGTPPAPSPTSVQPLVLEASVTIRANETDLIQRLLQALQNNPQAALYALIARDGSITVSNVRTSAGNGAAIEEASPVAAMAPASSQVPMPLLPPIARTPAPGPATNSQGSCSMFALNMQFTTGQAATDQSTATLLAEFPSSTGPAATDFTVQLAEGRRGSLDAVVPYTSSYFLLRVSTPEGYLGPVTVSYSTSELEPLRYEVVSSLVVKVTASSLTSTSR